MLSYIVSHTTHCLSVVLSELKGTHISEFMYSLADELPAYILVMLDNKRQWSDISQELEVFLVESTEPFVEWLKKEIDREWPCRQNGALFCTKRA